MSAHRFKHTLADALWQAIVRPAVACLLLVLSALVIAAFAVIVLLIVACAITGAVLTLIIGFEKTADFLNVNTSAKGEEGP